MAVDIQTVDDAKALIESNSAFLHAVAKLRKQWFNEFAQLDAAAPAYTNQCMAFQCKFSTLEAIPRELAVLISNYAHDQKRHSTPSVSPKTTRPGDIPDPP